MFLKSFDYLTLIKSNCMEHTLRDIDFVLWAVPLSVFLQGTKNGSFECSLPAYVSMPASDRIDLRRGY